MTGQGQQAAEEHLAALHPDIAERGTSDPRISIRELLRDCFVWSWTARGRRLWRSATNNDTKD